MSKAISRFEPTPSRTPEECERHYTSVHVPMAQNFLRPMVGLYSYHVNRALAQADVSGGWAQRPRAWRFALVRFAPGAALNFSAEQAEVVAQDHVNCLFRLRHCSLEETVLLDRRSEQLSRGSDPSACWTRRCASATSRRTSTIAAGERRRWGCWRGMDPYAIHPSPT